MRQQNWWLAGLSVMMLASCGTTPTATQDPAADTVVSADVEGAETDAADPGTSDQVLGAQALNAWPVLQQGSSGQAVTTAQYLLRASGRAVAVDGQFGPGTLAAVRSFQQSKGLGVDGKIGPATWGALVVTVRQGDQGEAVKAAQSELGIGVDGQFGPGTLAAVRSFQQSKGLGVDGVVGPNTWQALVAGTSSNPPASGDRAGLARQVQGNGRISLYPIQVSGVNDGADARSNIRDTANGGAARRSSYGNAPGGWTYLDARMLRGMLAVANTYSYRVTAIAGGSHSKGSSHYRGVVFDVDTINGRGVNSSNPYYRSFMAACRSAGAVTVLGPGTAGHSTHIHCGW